MLFRCGSDKDMLLGLREISRTQELNPDGGKNLTGGLTYIARPGGAIWESSGTRREKAAHDGLPGHRKHQSPPTLTGPLLPPRSLLHGAESQRPGCARSPSARIPQPHRTTDFQKARSTSRRRTSVAPNNRSRPAAHFRRRAPAVDCTIKAGEMGGTVGSGRSTHSRGRHGLRTRIRDRRVSMRSVA